MLFTSAVFSASEMARRLIASPAVPITVDSENAPASRPAAVPTSYPRSLRHSERREQARDAEDDCQRELGHGIALQGPEELRADLVARREQEEVEEDRLDQRRDLDVELPDQHAGQQTADDDPEAEAAELDPTDQEAERDRQEDRELRVLAQRR